MSDSGGNGPTGQRDVGLALALLAGFVAAMWLAELVDVPLDHDLDGLGVNPHEVGGLIGIPFMPFLHTGLCAPCLEYRSTARARDDGGAGSGRPPVRARHGDRHRQQRLLGIWLVADSGTLHLGASGVVFGYAAYLMVRGLYTRRATHLAVGAVVLLTYGATTLLAFEPRPGVSWQGHMFGALGGLFAAAFLGTSAHRNRPLTRACT